MIIVHSFIHLTSVTLLFDSYSAPQQSEASQDFLNSCSADGVSCTAETSTEEDGEDTAQSTPVIIKRVQ